MGRELGWFCLFLYATGGMKQLALQGTANDSMDVVQWFGAKKLESAGAAE